MHRDPRRQNRLLLHHPGGRRRRANDPNDRGPGRRRQAAPRARGLSRRGRLPVRILHAGHDHGRRRPCSKIRPIPPTPKSVSGMEKHLCRCCGFPENPKSHQTGGQRREVNAMTTIQNSTDTTNPANQRISQAEYQEPIERVALRLRHHPPRLRAGAWRGLAHHRQRAGTALGQRRRRAAAADARVIVSARIHIAKDGKITVLTGKVEEGQGARAELTQAAAEELRVPVSQVDLTTADTSLVPDDGVTAGSMHHAADRAGRAPGRRRGPAGTRQIAAERWGVDASTTGSPRRQDHPRRLRAHAELRRSGRKRRTCKGLWAGPAGRCHADARQGVESPRRFGPASEPPRPGNRRAQVSFRRHPARHVLRQSPPPAVLRREARVDRPRTGQGHERRRGGAGRPIRGRGRAHHASGPQGPGSHRPDGQMGDLPLQPSSKELFDYLRKHVRGEVPKNPFAEELANAGKVLKQTYHVAYVQHAPHGNPRRRGRVERRQVDGLDRHAESVRLPRGTGPRLPPARRRACG